MQIYHSAAGIRESRSAASRPRVDWLRNISHWCPFCCRNHAAESPPGPAPIMATFLPVGSAIPQARGLFQNLVKIVVGCISLQVIYPDTALPSSKKIPAARYLAWPDTHPPANCRQGINLFNQCHCFGKQAFFDE
jgi:hypothetical protein